MSDYCSFFAASYVQHKSPVPFLLYIATKKTCQINEIITVNSSMNAPISETKKITLARLACLCFDEGCPIHPIRNGSPKWCRSVTDRDGSSLCVSFGNVGGSSWWCRFATVCQFAMDLQNIFGGVMVCGESVGGSSRSGQTATTRRNRDG